MESKKERFRRILVGLADSGKFIPGIYNYCDRWCERCLLRHKCLTYAHEQEMREACLDPQTNDLDNEKFWEQIRLSFEVTLDMITEEAKRLGISLEDSSDDQERETDEGPVEKLARKYGHAVGKWLEENDEKLTTRISQLQSVSINKEMAQKFADAVEVVQWYCFYIAAKVHRSFFGVNTRMADGTEGLDLLADNRGSAKVAILAIDRSLEALMVLFSGMKDQEDVILGFLKMLSLLKKQLLVTFPTAMEFKRPGFDEQ